MHTFLWHTIFGVPYTLGVVAHSLHVLTDYAAVMVYVIKPATATACAKWEMDFTTVHGALRYQSQMIAVRDLRCIHKWLGFIGQEG